MECGRPLWGLQSGLVDEAGSGQGEEVTLKTVHERPCARGVNEAERRRFPGRLGLRFRLDLGLSVTAYQRRSAFAWALVTF